LTVAERLGQGFRMDLHQTALSAADVIRLLRLQPHPEGGHFRETFRDSRSEGGRAHSTAIYYLLARGERSHWHRIDAAEVWHWYAGAPLELAIAEPGQPAVTRRLGCDLAAGEAPQAVVPAHAWRAAESLGDWTLVGCTVAPGFVFDRFELAPPDWTPEQG
jgi:predicted cupin superfamily sugar epimerase